MEYPNTLEVLNRFASALIDTYKSKLAENDYTSGQLYNTIRVNSVRAVAGSFLVQIDLEEYWKYIEHGRRAGAKMPPINAIENWITKRNILSKPMTLKSGKSVIPTQRQLAFLIARSISRNGIKARPFMKQSITQIRKQFIDEIKEALVLDLTKLD